MLNEQTTQKLLAMRLGAMALAWQEQQTDKRVSKLSFDERFSLLVDVEHLARDNRRLERLLKNAQLRFPDACLEDVEASTARGLPQFGIEGASFRPAPPGRNPGLDGFLDFLAKTH